jgi:hypothetical protein
MGCEAVFCERGGLRREDRTVAGRKLRAAADTSVLVALEQLDRLERRAGRHRRAK